MHRLKSFFKLSADRKILFIQSLVLIIFIRFSLSLLPFPKVKSILNKFSVVNNDIKKTKTLEDIVWSVGAASNYVPRATCLTKAIAAQIQLSRYNYRSSLKVGVNKSEEFEAHAWIEIEDKVVLGESETDYIPIWELNQ
jgi:hypothetical protein